MRIAIVTDIHEDICNLEKVFARIDAIGCDKIICLGDITGFAPKFHSHRPDANACIDLLRFFSVHCIAGNHDLYTLKKLPAYHREYKMPDHWYDLPFREQQKLAGNTVWLYEDEVTPRLSRENNDYLQRAATYFIVETGERSLLFSHFVSPDHAGISKWFPKHTYELRQHFGMMKEFRCNLAFVGHCHPEGVNFIERYNWAEPLYKSFETGPSKSIVMCPPVVSGPKATGFVIYDSVSSCIHPFFFDDF